jgi:hypothetical protein
MQLSQYESASTHILSKVLWIVRSIHNVRKSDLYERRTPSLLEDGSSSLVLAQNEPSIQNYILQ